MYILISAFSHSNEATDRIKDSCILRLYMGLRAYTYVCVIWYITYYITCNIFFDVVAQRKRSYITQTYLYYIHLQWNISL